MVMSAMGMPIIAVEALGHNTRYIIPATSAMVPAGMPAPVDLTFVN